MTKGLWIPIELLHDKNTTMQEKLLLIEINQLSMLDKGCIASNDHFAKTFKVQKQSISRSISSLEKKGYLSTEITPGSRNHERRITINKMLFGYKQNVNTPLTKCLETKENKTFNKTININIDFNDYPNINNQAAQEWFDYKKYKTKAPVTKTLNFLSKYSFEVQSQIVDTSIMNGYQGLFAPKTNNFTNKNEGRKRAIDEAFDMLNQNNEMIDYEC